ncbi:MAG TPA: D-arabinitol 4-dehydrogenase [Caulobacteraceae bacterium]|nr:D-arabinitol 4-dehydrogenase [Caulobacteraceae bacterium]
MTASILHLGLGAFHRAHQAAYLQALASLGERDWRLVCGNIRGDGLKVEQALVAQHGRYVLETVSSAGARAYQTIDVIQRVLSFTPDLAAVTAAGADPDTRIISMTVTEAGYHLKPDMTLEEDAPDVAADLRTGSHRTLYGALSLILGARMAKGAGPVTLLSCDNLRGNGRRLSAGLRAFLAARGEHALLAWCAQNVTTPSSMVDRITPGPPPELGARVRAAAGWADQAPVMAEDFHQWVIEDDFAAGRPRLERVCVQFVDDVAPYEEAKIRILNASHSAIAWAGVLKGYEFIHQGAADPAIAALARAFIIDAAIPCLSPSPIDLAAYGATTLSRFANAEIRDTNQRVAADSWAKLAGFIAPTLGDCLARGVGLDSAAMPPALFLVFMRRWAEGRLPFRYEDQSLDPAAMRGILDADDPAGALSAEHRFWHDSAGDARLADAVRRALPRVESMLGGGRTAG